jgi:hypothetical protein
VNWNVALPAPIQSIAGEELSKEIADAVARGRAESFEFWKPI